MAEHAGMSIIVSNWNGRALLERFLPSVMEASRAYPGETEIIVADDASTDDSLGWLAKNYPAVRVARTPENRGFSSNINNAMAAARQPVVLTLNNDVELERDALTFISVHFDNKEIFAVRLKSVVCENNAPLSGQLLPRRYGIEFRNGMLHLPEGTLEEGAPELSSLAFNAGGGAAAFDRSKFISLGGYDELFNPFYWEDADLSYRAWKRGWKIVYEPKGVCRHHHHSTIARTLMPHTVYSIGARNRLFLIWKNISDLRLLLIHALFLPLYLAWNAVRGRTYVLTGFVQALRSLPAVAKKRVDEKNGRLLSDGEILFLFKQYRIYRRKAASPPAFVCPSCAAPLVNRPDRLTCPTEDLSWPKEKGIPRFLPSSWYWGEIPQEDMKKILASMESGIHWKEALKRSPSKEAREKYLFIADEGRANWHWFLPGGKEHRVLDVGCGMGTLSAGLAKRFGEIVAVEPVAERVAFCRLRMEQDGITNVALLQSDLYHLPFPDNSFDLIVMNGVFEWLGSTETGDPAAWQERGLAIAWRLLRPGGTLYIGIENRFGYDSFMGRVDHSGLRFTALMPRFLADLYSRVVNGKPYRTFIYGKGGYTRLLKKAGFSEVRFLYPLGSYNCPYVIFDSPRLLPAFRSQFDQHRGLRKLRNLAERWMARSGALDFLFSDFLILATKEKTAEKAPVEQVLAEIRPGGETRRLPAYCLSRLLPNFFVFTAPGAHRPELLVRFAPDERYAAQLRRTATTFASLKQNLPETLARSIPVVRAVTAYGGHTCSVEGVIDSRPFPSLPSLGRDALRSAFDWLKELRARLPAGTTGGDIRSEILSSWAKAQEHFPELKTKANARAFRRHIENLFPYLGRPSPQHGDFWHENLGIGNDGGLVVYDWTSFGETSLPAFDATHLVVSLLHCGDGAADAAGLLRSLGNIPFLEEEYLRYLPDLGVEASARKYYLPAYLATYIALYAAEPAREKMVSRYAGILRNTLENT